MKHAEAAYAFSALPTRHRTILLRALKPIRQSLETEMTRVCEDDGDRVRNEYMAAALGDDIIAINEMLSWCMKEQKGGVTV